MEESRNNYYRVTLMTHLRYAYPHLVQDEDLISSRAAAAQESFSSARRSGCSVLAAQEISDSVLFEGLGFSLWRELCDIAELRFGRQPDDALLRLFLTDAFRDEFSQFRLSDDPFIEQGEYDALHAKAVLMVFLFYLLADIESERDYFGTWADEGFQDTLRGYAVSLDAYESLPEGIVGDLFPDSELSDYAVLRERAICYLMEI